MNTTLHYIFNKKYVDEAKKKVNNICQNCEHYNGKYLCIKYRIHTVRYNSCAFFYPNSFHVGLIKARYIQDCTKNKINYKENDI